MNTSLVIKLDPMGSEDETGSEPEVTPFIKKSTEFTYLNAEEEDITPFDNLKWFDGRPIYYWIEAFVIIVSTSGWVLPVDNIIQLYGVTSVLNWLSLVMFLIKMFVVIGVVEIPNAFTFQLQFQTGNRTSNRK